MASWQQIRNNWNRAVKDAEADEARKVDRERTNTKMCNGCQQLFLLTLAGSWQKKSDGSYYCSIHCIPGSSNDGNPLED